MPDSFTQLRAAGFNDEEIAAWSAKTRTELTGAGFSENEIDDYFGQPKTPNGVPAALVDRVLKGAAFAKAMAEYVPQVRQGEAMASGAVNGTIQQVKGIVNNLLPKEFGGERQPEKEGTVEAISKTGSALFGLATLPFAPLTGAVHAIADQPITLTLDAMRRGAVALYGEDKVAQAEKDQPFLKTGTGADAKSIVDTAMMLLMPTKQINRIGMGPGGQPELLKIGGLPQGEDFGNAARVIGNGDATPAVEDKLARLYDQKGLHPAEVAHDAAHDVTITQSLLSSDKADMPQAYGPSGPPEGERPLGGMAGYGGFGEAFETGYQYHGYEPLPEATAEAEQSAAGFRKAGLQGAVAEPYFQNVPAPVGEDFEIKPLEQKEDFREKLLLEGKPVEYTDAEKQILSKVSVDEKAPTRALSWSRLYTNTIDKLFPISKAVKETGQALPAEQNPYQLARLMAGHVGKADHFLNEGTFDFHTYENNGPSVREILAPVKDDLNGFRAYATASRAVELEGRGIESGFATEGGGAPPLVSSGLDAARSVLIDGRAKFEKPFHALVDYQNRVSQYLRDSGVLSEAGYKAMLEANKLYVPFTRVMGIPDDAPIFGGRSLQARNPIKEIKGSARAIVDPIESVVRNTYHMMEMAERNQVGTKLVDMLKRAGEELPEAPAAVETLPNADQARSGAIGEALGEVGVKRPAELADALAHATEPVREGEIAILRDGKRETYKVDPELARAIKGLDAQSMGLLEKVLSYPASTLRAGAVTTPDFAIRHSIRDFLYAFTTLKGGVFTPWDMAKGFSGLLMKDEDYWNWLKGGGGNISMVGLDRQYMQEDLRELTGKTGLVGRAWNVLADPDASMWQKTGAVTSLPFKAIDKFVLDPLRTLTQFAENASHLAAFKKTMRGLEEEGPQDLRTQIIRSAYASRDTAVDAARMGANMRAYNMITAFANIKLQDTDRVVRAIIDNPIGSLTKIGAAITVPSVVLWAANHDDPRYKEIPQWEKDMFWLVMTPDHVFRIPKPWAMGMIFGTLPERMLDAWGASKPEAFKEYFKSLWQTSGPDFVPTAASPLIDQFANRSTFTNRTLIPSEQEKFLPEYQYTPYTTELAKEIGQIIGAFPGMSQLKTDNSGFGGVARALTSPILIENYVRAWTGTLGVYALQAADLALRKAGELPDPPKPASTLADIPVVKAFVVRYPSASAQSIQDFYDKYEANKAYFLTWQAMAKDGNIAAMKHIADMGGDQMFVQLDSIRDVLTEHNQLIRDIYKNPEMKSEEKRQLIDTLYGNMIQAAGAGNQVIRTMQQKSQQTAPPVLNSPTLPQ